MDCDNDIHYLLGQLSMANELVDEYSKYKTPIGRKKLKEIKASRQTVLNKISALANRALIYVPNDKGVSKE